MAIIASKETLELRQKECDETKVFIGKIIQDKRKEMKLSPYKISKETGLSHDQISAIENADKRYTFDSLIKYCKVVDISLLSLKV